MKQLVIEAQPGKTLALALAALVGQRIREVVVSEDDSRMLQRHVRRYVTDAPPGQAAVQTAISESHFEADSAHIAVITGEDAEHIQVTHIRLKAAKECGQSRAGHGCDAGHHEAPCETNPGAPPVACPGQAIVIVRIVHFPGGAPEEAQPFAHLDAAFKTTDANWGLDWARRVTQTATQTPITAPPFPSGPGVTHWIPTRDGSRWFVFRECKLL